MRQRSLLGSRGLALLLCGCLSSQLWPTEARANQTADDIARSNARQLATEASEAYRAAKYDVAYDLFNRAFKLVGVPALGVWSARSLEKGGRLVESAERYREVLAQPAGGDVAAESSRRDARIELDDLAPRIPNLIIRLENAKASEVRVTLDGAEVPAELLDVKQHVNPGRHVLVAERGKERHEQEVTLAERQTVEQALVFEILPDYAVAAGASPEDEKSQPGFDGRTVGLVSMGIGAAFLVEGIITGVVALGQESDLASTCDENRVCPPSAQGQVNDLETMKTLSTVGFIGAGVFGALGVTLFVVGGPDDSSAAKSASAAPVRTPAAKPQLAVRLAPTSAQLFGTF